VRPTLRCLGGLAATMLCVAVVGSCGDDDSAQPVLTAEEGGRGDGRGRNDGGAGTNDDDNGGGGGGGRVPGAPIDIPPITEEELDAALASIETTVLDQCGGQPCITIVVEKTDDAADECTFIRTDPRQGPSGVQIERGGTLRVITESRPCVDAP
jgi:hypothetical protein